MPKGTDFRTILSRIWTLVTCLLCLATTRSWGQMQAGESSSTLEPEFAEPIPNITISAGREVSLPCVVDNLGGYRVAWIHTARYTLLTLHNRVITRSTRYKVTSHAHRTWWLHISDVEERDRGEYMCQINTSPMKSQVGFVEVVVPPQIQENQTSSDTEVREGADVVLRCLAKGSPEPEVKWRREDGHEIAVDKKKVTVQTGPFLNISKVSRLHTGPYLCIASNNIPPSVSKRIVLTVNFAPMIWIPNQLVGAPVGTDVNLDCNLESQPRSVTYWTREGGGIVILSNAKYDSVLLQTGLYKVQMRLRIRSLGAEDYGSYTCVAKNSLGETEGTIRLYEIPPPSSTSSSHDSIRAKTEKLRNGYANNAISKPEQRHDYSSSRSPQDTHMTGKTTDERTWSTERDITTSLSDSTTSVGATSGRQQQQELLLLCMGMMQVMLL